MSKTEIIFKLACDTAANIENFQLILGAGEGNRSTNSFMQILRSRIFEKFNFDYSEKLICGDNSFAVDFYIAERKHDYRNCIGVTKSAERI